MEEVVQRPTFIFNDVEYYADTLSEDVKGFINNVQIIDGEIKKINLQLEITNVAKDSFISKIEAEVENFEKVPETEGEN